MDELSIALIVAIGVTILGAIVGVLQNVLLHRKSKLKNKNSAVVMETTDLELAVNNRELVTLSFIAGDITNIIISSNKIKESKRRTLCSEKLPETKPSRYKIKAEYNKYSTNDRRVA